MSNSSKECEDLKSELAEVDAKIAHLNQKYEVQVKRLKYLKKENQELKEREEEESIATQEIHEQYEEFKAKNRELKAKLNEIKKVLICNGSGSSSNKPKQIMIKQSLIKVNSEEVDLTRSELTDDDLMELKHCQKMKTLILNENCITQLGLVMICEVLPHLRKLFISHNKITDRGLNSLHKVKQLRYLDLRCNQLTSVSMQSICQLPHLTQLSLSNNSIDDQGLTYCSELQELKYLDITSNKLTGSTLEALSGCSNLSNLYLSHNQIGMEPLMHLISKLKNLKVLDIRFNKLSPQQKEQVRSRVDTEMQLFI